MSKKVKLKSNFQKYFVFPIVLCLILTIIITSLSLLYYSTESSNHKVIKSIKEWKKQSMAPQIDTTSSMIYYKYSYCIDTILVIRKTYLDYLENHKLNLDRNHIKEYLTKTMINGIDYNKLTTTEKENLMTRFIWFLNPDNTSLDKLSDSQLTNLYFISTLKFLLEAILTSSNTKIESIYFGINNENIYASYVRSIEDETYHKLTANDDGYTNCLHGINYYYFKCRDWYLNFSTLRKKYAQIIHPLPPYLNSSKKEWRFSLCTRLKGFEINMNKDTNEEQVGASSNEDNFILMCMDIDMNETLIHLDELNSLMQGYFFISQYNTSPNYPFYYPNKLNTRTHKTLLSQYFYRNSDFSINQIFDLENKLLTLVTLLQSDEISDNALYEYNYNNDNDKSYYIMKSIKLNLDNNTNNLVNSFYIIYCSYDGSLTEFKEYEVDVKKKILFQFGLFTFMGFALILLSRFLLNSLANMIHKPIRVLNAILLQNDSNIEAINEIDKVQTKAKDNRIKKDISFKSESKSYKANSSKDNSYNENEENKKNSKRQNRMLSQAFANDYDEDRVDLLADIEERPRLFDNENNEETADNDIQHAEEENYNYNKGSKIKKKVTSISFLTGEDFSNISIDLESLYQIMLRMRKIFKISDKKAFYIKDYKNALKQTINLEKGNFSKINQIIKDQRKLIHQENYNSKKNNMETLTDYIELKNVLKDFSCENITYKNESNLGNVLISLQKWDKAINHFCSSLCILGINQNHKKISIDDKVKKDISKLSLNEGMLHINKLRKAAQLLNSNEKFDKIKLHHKKPRKDKRRSINLYSFQKGYSANQNLRLVNTIDDGNNNELNQYKANSQNNNFVLSENLIKNNNNIDDVNVQNPSKNNSIYIKDTKNINKHDQEYDNNEENVSNYSNEDETFPRFKKKASRLDKIKEFLLQNVLNKLNNISRKRNTDKEFSEKINLNNIRLCLEHRFPKLIYCFNQLYFKFIHAAKTHEALLSIENNFKIKVFNYEDQFNKLKEKIENEMTFFNDIIFSSETHSIETFEKTLKQNIYFANQYSDYIEDEYSEIILFAKSKQGESLLNYISFLLDFKLDCKQSVYFNTKLKNKSINNDTINKEYIKESEELISFILDLFKEFEVLINDIIEISNKDFKGGDCNALHLLDIYKMSPYINFSNETVVLIQKYNLLKGKLYYLCSDFKQAIKYLLLSKEKQNFYDAEVFKQATDLLIVVYSKLYDFNYKKASNTRKFTDKIDPKQEDCLNALSKLIREERTILSKFSFKSKDVIICFDNYAFEEDNTQGNQIIKYIHLVFDKYIIKNSDRFSFVNYSKEYGFKKICSLMEKNDHNIKYAKHLIQEIRTSAIYLENNNNGEIGKENLTNPQYSNPGTPFRKKSSNPKVISSKNINIIDNFYHQDKEISIKNKKQIIELDNVEEINEYNDKDNSSSEGSNSENKEVINKVSSNLSSTKQIKESSTNTFNEVGPISNQELIDDASKINFKSINRQRTSELTVSLHSKLLHRSLSNKLSENKSKDEDNLFFDESPQIEIKNVQKEIIKRMEESFENSEYNELLESRNRNRTKTFRLMKNSFISKENRDSINIDNTNNSLEEFEEINLFNNILSIQRYYDKSQIKKHLSSYFMKSKSSDLNKSEKQSFDADDDIEQDLNMNINSLKSSSKFNQFKESIDLSEEDKDRMFNIFNLLGAEEENTKKFFIVFISKFEKSEFNFIENDKQSLFDHFKDSTLILVLTKRNYTSKEKTNNIFSNENDMKEKERNFIRSSSNLFTPLFYQSKFSMKSENENNNNEFKYQVDDLFLFLNEKLNCKNIVVVNIRDFEKKMNDLFTQKGEITSLYGFPKETSI